MLRWLALVAVLVCTVHAKIFYHYEYDKGNETQALAVRSVSTYLSQQHILTMIGQEKDVYIFILHARGDTYLDMVEALERQSHGDQLFFRPLGDVVVIVNPRDYTHIAGDPTRYLAAHENGTVINVDQMYRHIVHHERLVDIAFKLAYIDLAPPIKTVHVHLQSIAFDPTSGSLYGYDGSSGSSGLYKINTTTGEAVRVFPVQSSLHRDADPQPEPKPRFIARMREMAWSLCHLALSAFIAIGSVSLCICVLAVLFHCLEWSTNNIKAKML